MLDITKNETDYPQKSGPSGCKNKLLNVFSDIENVSSKSIWDEYEFSRFCVPSKEGIKEISKIENIIIENLPKDIDLIRVSPLVPKGVYNFLSGMSLNRSIQTNRGFEVCSDLSVSLALEGLLRRKKKKQIKTQSIGGFNATVRSQSFYGCNNQKKVPNIHFSMYGNAIVGEEGKEFFFAKKNLPNLIEHYLTILEQLNEGDFSIDDVEIHIADMGHTNQILAKFDNSINKFRDYQLRERTKLGREPSMNDYLGTDIHQYHDSVASLDDEVNKNNFGLSLGYLICIFNEIEKLKEKFPIKTKLVLGRSRGAGQYSSIAFSIFAKNKSGEVFDIADGGMTDRGEKLLNKKERCLVGGLGVDLLAKGYKK